MRFFSLSTLILLIAAPAPAQGQLKEASSAQQKSAKPKKNSARPLDEILLFFPSRFPQGNWKPKGLDFEDVWFKADDGTALHGWYCPVKKARAVVLYAHGNAGNLSHRRRLVEYLQKKLRLTVLIFDYRGYGRSKGAPTVKGVLMDARAASKFLARKARIKESEIVLMGRSLGGAVVAQLAAQTGPRGLILESTFSSLYDVAAHHYPRVAWLVSKEKLNSAKQITRYKGPLLQSHGNADRTIPYALGLKLYRSANKPKQFVTIRGGDHNDPQPPYYYRELDRFIDNLPRSNRSLEK